MRELSGTENFVYMQNTLFVRFEIREFPFLFLMFHFIYSMLAVYLFFCFCFVFVYFIARIWEGTVIRNYYNHVRCDNVQVDRFVKLFSMPSEIQYLRLKHSFYEIIIRFSLQKCHKHTQAHTWTIHFLHILAKHIGYSLSNHGHIDK